MNLKIKEKTHRRRKLKSYQRRMESRGGINEEFGINRYKLLHIKQIRNKELLYEKVNLF